MLILITLLLFADNVENGLQPVKAKNVSIKKEFVIGVNDDDPIIPNGADVAVDSEGGFYLLDPQDKKVHCFDKTGKHVRSFGSEGQGPGEFQTPLAIGVDMQDHIVVFDTANRRAEYFDKEGNLKKEVSFKTGMVHVSRPYFFEDGKSLIWSVSMSPTFQQSYDLSLYDADLNHVKQVLAKTLPQQDWNQAADPNFWVDFLVHHFTALADGPPAGAKVGEKKMVAMMGNKYKGHFFSLEGEELGTFTSDYRKKPFTDEIKRKILTPVWEAMAANPQLQQVLSKPVFEKALDKTEVPEFQGPLAGLWPAKEGFCVMSNYDLFTEKGQIDFFDKNGRLVAQTPFKGKFTNIIGRGNRMYMIGSDADDNYILTVYSYDGL